MCSVLERKGCLYLKTENIDIKTQYWHRKWPNTPLTFRSQDLHYLVLETLFEINCLRIQIISHCKYLSILYETCHFFRTALVDKLIHRRGFWICKNISKCGKKWNLKYEFMAVHFTYKILVWETGPWIFEIWLQVTTVIFFLWNLVDLQLYNYKYFFLYNEMITTENKKFIGIHDDCVYSCCCSMLPIMGLCTRLYHSWQ